MGNLLNPIALRLNYNKFWKFNWISFTKKNYSYLLINDFIFFKFLNFFFFFFKLLEKQRICSFFSFKFFRKSNNCLKFFIFYVPLSFSFKTFKFKMIKKLILTLFFNLKIKLKYFFYHFKNNKLFFNFNFIKYLFKNKQNKNSFYFIYQNWNFIKNLYLIYKKLKNKHKITFINFLDIFLLSYKKFNNFNFIFKLKYNNLNIITLILKNCIKKKKQNFLKFIFIFKYLKKFCFLFFYMFFFNGYRYLSLKKIRNIYNLNIFEILIYYFRKLNALLKKKKFIFEIFLIPYLLKFYKKNNNLKIFYRKILNFLFFYKKFLNLKFFFFNNNIDFLKKNKKKDIKCFFFFKKNLKKNIFKLLKEKIILLKKKYRYKKRKVTIQLKKKLLKKITFNVLKNIRKHFFKYFFLILLKKKSKIFKNINILSLPTLIKKNLLYFNFLLKRNVLKKNIHFFSNITSNKNTVVLSKKYNILNINYYIYILKKLIKKKPFEILNFISKLGRNLKKRLEITGFKIKLKGRFSKKTRSNKFIYKFGRMTPNTLDCYLDYVEDVFFTKYGLYSIKIWLYIKKKHTLYNIKNIYKNKIIFNNI